MENFVKEFAAREERAVKRLESTKADFEVAKEQVKVPFEHKDKIMELNTELSELNAELDLNKREEVVIDDEENGEEPVTAETEDNYMALPPKRTEIKARTNKKKTMLTEKLYKTYKQTEEQNPGAMVFAVKNGDYTCFDDTTEELTALSSLSPSYFKVGEKEVKTLTIDETLFKEFASAFVSAGLKIALFDEPEEEKTFIDESDRVAAMQVDILPDYTVSQEQMHEYGYTWDGMLPVRIRTARVLYGAGVELYRLGKDDTEGKVENGNFEDTESLYGVEKPAWQAFISSERGKAYLTAWHNVVESASEVVREDMSYLDGMYADSISDGFYEERTAIDRVLNGEYAPSEEAKPFIKPLLERYHKRFPLDILLEYYGWDYDDVYNALAENIPDAELREYATNTEKKVSFDEFKKMGRKVTIRANEMPEAWADQTVGAILGYWEYLGWTVNFKTKKKSFKSKKVILLPSDEWQVFKDTQEPIIDEETFWAVQKIREGKRRLDSLGEPNALSGMLFCGDCGHRLYLRRQRDPHQKDYFVCSVYRKKRKYFCTAHFIRLADIEKILLRDLRQVTAFAREHESEFLDLAKKRSLRETEKLRAENKASLDKAVRRIAEIDGIIQKLYEDNVSGKISDERFAKMTATYETEQNGLQQTAQRLKDDISAVREEGESVDRFMKLVNKYSDITELNAEIIRTFVEKIVVYEAEKNDGVKTQKVKIVYNCVGTVSVPNTDNEAVKTDKTKIIEVA